MTFTEAFTAHYRPLVGHVRRMFPYTEAEDVVQTAFLRAWRHPEYDITYRLLCHIARGVALNALRDNPPTRYVSADEVELYDSWHGAERTVVARSELRWRLSGLSQRHRQALVMRALGYSCAEVARRLGVKEKAAKNLISRGLARTRRVVSVRP